MRNEQLLNYPLEISGRRETKNRVAVAVERVPRELIEDIQIAPFANDLLDKNYRFLCQEDYWRDRIELSVPFGDKAKGRMTPIVWGRAIPVAYGQIPYGQFVGGVLMAKGVFRTGRYYPRSDRLTPAKSFDAMPLGFFGDSDAHKEFKIAETLLAVGFRSSLPVVSVVFKTSKMRQYLLNKWVGYELCDDIDECFNILHENGDNPAYLARVTGVVSRKDAIFCHGWAPRRTPEIGWAADLWLAEWQKFPEHFEEYCGRVNKKMLKDTFTKMVLGKNLSEPEFGALSYFCSGLIEYNSKCLLSDRVGKELLRRYDNLPRLLSDPKDSCLAGFTMDYEEAQARSPKREQIKTVGELSRAYYDSAMGVMDRWLRNNEQVLIGRNGSVLE